MPGADTAPNPYEQGCEQMGGEQDHTEPHAAHHPGSHRADDERRAAVDAEAEHPPPLFPRDLSALDQFPHRHAAGGVSPDKPDQDPRSAAARQAEQGRVTPSRRRPSAALIPERTRNPASTKKGKREGMMTPEQMERPRLTPPAAAWGQISSAAPAARIRISSPPIFRCAARTVLTNIPFTLSSSA